MLSRDAFNALLKTLEEPPAQVTFVLATTEPHKFPATIVSRCQHYVFKRLSDAELFSHLQKILGREGVEYEDTALRLLARRAAGSARDAVTLLSQVLALSGASVKEADTRAILGLAGQELFFELLGAIRRGDCASLSALTGQLLDQGIDLGFFLREMTLMWRNLFMLRQIGEAAETLTELPKAEAQKWRAEAQRMDLSHIHACWQMTIEGQRRVLTSLEPALALELLLFNLAMLPRLMSLDQLSAVERMRASGEKKAEPLPDAPETGAANPAQAGEQKLPAENGLPPEKMPHPRKDRGLPEKEPGPAGEDKREEEPGSPERDKLLPEEEAGVLADLRGKTPEPRLLPPPEAGRKPADLKNAIEQLPIFQALKERFGASLVDCGRREE
jgi:DNA polymerase-3 subunit gamma/tau